MVTLEEVNSLLEYNPDTGLFKWKPGLGNKSKLKVAGSRDMSRPIAIEIYGVKYFAHRLAWLIVNGKWPDKAIDHINGICTDNRICNLREATIAENNMNCKISARNTSGVKGIYWNKAFKKWHGRLRVDGKNIHIGLFDDLEFADLAMSEARIKFHHEFARDR